MTRPQIEELLPRPPVEELLRLTGTGHTYMLLWHVTSNDTGPCCWTLRGNDGSTLGTIYFPDGQDAGLIVAAVNNLAALCQRVLDLEAALRDMAHDFWEEWGDEGPRTVRSKVETLLRPVR